MGQKEWTTECSNKQASGLTSSGALPAAAALQALLGFGSLARRAEVQVLRLPLQLKNVLLLLLALALFFHFLLCSTQTQLDDGS